MKKTHFKLYLTEKEILNVADTRRRSNVDYPHEKVIKNEEDLFYANRFDMVFSFLYKFKRAKGNFISSDVLFADVDNTHKSAVENEEYITIKDCINTYLRGVEAYYFTSRNHMIQKKAMSPRPKFHIVFPIGKLITDIKKYEDNLKKMIRKWTFFDPANKDASRFFFGNPTTEVTYNPGDSILKKLKDVGIDASFRQLTNLSNKSIKENGYAGRNDYLLKLASHLRKKETPSNVAKILADANTRFDSPLPEQEIDNILCSYNKKEYRDTNFLTLGNEAKKFLEDFGDSVLYDHRNKRNNPWYYYDNIRWRKDYEGVVFRYVETRVSKRIDEMYTTEDKTYKKALLQFVRTLDRETALNSILNYAKNFVPLPYDCKNNPDNIFDRKKHLLNMQNGTFNLKTKKVEKHDPKNYLSNTLSFAYDPLAKCPLFDRFLTEVCNNNTELENFLLKIFGYCLTGDVNEDKFFIFIGKGDNGKTTLLNTIRNVLSDNFSGSLPVSAIERKQDFDLPSYLAMLKGKRFVTISEYDKTKVLDESKLKAYIGGTPILARNKFEKPILFEPQFKLIMDTNYLPRIKGADASEGIWRRICVIPFNVSFKGRNDIHLEDKLKKEAPGIFNRLVKGLAAYEDEGFKIPRIVLKSGKEYRDVQSDLIEFIEDYCEIDSNFFITSRELFAQYKIYCEDNNIKLPTLKNFVSNVIALSPKIKRDRKRTGIGSRARGLLGIRLSSKTEM